jgi:hypothetical protein
MPTEAQSLQVNLRGQEAAEVMLTPVFFDEGIEQIARVIPTMTQNEQDLAYLGEIEDIIQNYEKCGFSPKGSSELYRRKLRVENCKVDLQFCVDGIMNTVFTALLKRGVNIQDISGTDIEQMIAIRAQQALRKNLTKLFWFGNTASNNNTLNKFDGVWGRWIPELVVDGLVNPVDLNSGTALADGDGYLFLKEVWEAAEPELRGIAENQKSFSVTQTIYDQYLSDLESGALSGGGFYQVVTDGIKRVYFRNVEVRCKYEWDSLFKKLGQPNQHRILLSTNDNFVFGTDMLSDTTSFMMWFDQINEVFKLKTRFKAGTQYLHHQFIACGF